MQPNVRLTLAIQKNGRLSNDSIALLQNLGLTFLPSKSSLYCSLENFPLDILFVRDDDIPALIKDKACDLGIVGENVLYEHDQNCFEILKPLSFGCCRLSIATPTESTFNNIFSLESMRIATSYPNLLQQFLNKKSINAKIVTISGSVEIAPLLGISDAICDLVSTGKTLAENNLIERVTILNSQAVLVKGKEKLSSVKNKIIETLLGSLKYLGSTNAGVEKRSI